ncbi:ABC transporter family protein [Trichomonas vaginalis G3]|uniref:ABC transporter family protein n=1 Tax=Trichomonas vaginalis (strain ATCC PRA-98 / G3) TaxID=412133 RepID=A2FXZ4_TRIV3|nr:ATPase activity, coupled to transmembrane movement of substances [Trichomonas vaginalis G3]EAX90217.1 ABC transporter family protein [Trichomonas vaginalis G3]KAI5553946.1 ATPase activity, coupled to transmembrane movement of substances [Trichomonas vaginalis G3]|eukprot:XP_001303147.1 ABC transporter family protein [Trichomonas vaginalis G3]
MSVKLFKNQLTGIMYRRLLVYWNSKFSFLINFIFSLFVAGLFGIIATLVHGIVKPRGAQGLEFTNFDPNNLTFGRISIKNCTKCDEIQNRLSEKFSYFIKKRLNTDLQYIDFDNFEDFNDYQYERVLDPRKLSNIPLAFQVYENSSIIKENGVPEGELNLRFLHNLTYSDTALKLFNRALLEILFDELGEKGDVDVSLTVHDERQFVLDTNIESTYELIVPYFMPFALVIIAANFMHKTIQDIKTPVRPYMISCGLSRFTYWTGIVIVDLIIMTIFSTYVFVIYYSIGILSFKMFVAKTLFFNWFCSILPLFYTYFWSFLIKGTAGAIVFVISNLSILMTILITSFSFRESQYPAVYSILTLICPFGNWFGVFWRISKTFSLYYPDLPKNIDFFKQGKYVLNIMYASVFVYPLIIWLVEFLVKVISHKISKMSFESHIDDFRAIKENLQITEESIQMENNVRDQPNDYAIRIFNVSKIFKYTKGQPICAVNQVSLGIKDKSIFGFLGSNGAGKTTLMKMILKEIPISSGTIEINGQNVETSKITNVAVCPQFDDHLTEQLTGRQNMKFFCYLFNKSGKEANELINRIIEVMDYSQHVDKKIKDMSGGNRRKCAASIPFLSDYKTILLDEPTSSLDPIARHHMHELINQYKGERTFMLCTHLLDEAESLCDNISIMSSGCIFTVGTPQYLSNKFGTE